MKFEKYPEEIAKTLYDLSADMDAQDYEEQKEEELKDLTNALYDLKAICENEHNQNYWRTLWKALEMLQ
jgi:hypothetical protein